MLCYLSTLQELNTVLEKEKNFIIYKFNSTGCSVSNRTLESVEQAQKEGNIHHIYFVDIIKHRELSDSLVKITAIKHESPQAIVFKEGKPSIHRSHMHITKDRILENSPFRGRA